MLECLSFLSRKEVRVGPLARWPGSLGAWPKRTSAALLNLLFSLSQCCLHHRPHVAFDDLNPLRPGRAAVGDERRAGRLSAQGLSRDRFAALRAGCTRGASADGRPASPDRRRARGPGQLPTEVSSDQAVASCLPGATRYSGEASHSGVSGGL